MQQEIKYIRVLVIAIRLLFNYTVFRKKTPTHIFFHISMIW